MRLHSMRIDAGMGPLWYKTKTFYTEKDVNEFLETNPDFGLLKELKTYENKPAYVTARNDDKGHKILGLKFDYEDTGFCQRYYRAECGRIFVMVDGQLHTCNDDAWREPCTPVKHDYFNIED